MWPKAIIFLKERHFFYHDLNRSCILEHWLEVKLLSCVSLFATQWTVAHHAPLSIGFSRQAYWSGLAFPSPGELSQPRDRTRVSCIADRRFTLWATREAHRLYNRALVPPRGLTAGRDASPSTAATRAPSLAGHCQPTPLPTHTSAGDLQTLMVGLDQSPVGSVFLAAGF